MHWSDFTRRRVHYENRKCRRLRRPKWMNRWHQNAISYEKTILIKFVLPWRFRCMGLIWLVPQNEGNSRCAWIEPDKQQPNGPMMIGRGQKNDWSAKSIRRHLLNVSFSIHYSNIMSNNYCRKLGLRQPVPEAHSPKDLLKWRLLQKKRCRGGTHNRWQVCGISGLSIRCWDWNHHLENRWYGPHCGSAGERDLWYHIEWADAVEEGILETLDRVWSLVEGNWHSDPPETIEQCVIHFGCQRCILWDIYQSQFSIWVLVTISPPIFLNGYISAMWKRHIDPPTKSITLDRCWSTMTGEPDWTILRRNCRILPLKAVMILTLQKFQPTIRCR